mmetsp:Transcript_61394/g.165164  ORF Transcript_61394/g.165164 Transcript_61394/m.165164 type:complete len:123 (+) Transcript_61394:128-496(+)
MLQASGAESRGRNYNNCKICLNVLFEQLVTCQGPQEEGGPEDWAFSTSFWSEPLECNALSCGLFSMACAARSWWAWRSAEAISSPQDVDVSQSGRLPSPPPAPPAPPTQGSRGLDGSQGPGL